MSENKRHEKVLSTAPLTLGTLQADKNKTWLYYAAITLALFIKINSPALLRSGQIALVHLFKFALSRLHAVAKDNTEYQPPSDQKILSCLETIILLKLYSPRSSSEYSKPTACIVDPYIPAPLSVHFRR